MKKNLFGISMITMACLYGILVIVAIAVCFACGFPIIYALVGGILVLLIQFALSPILTDLTMRWLYQTDFNCDMPAYLKEFIQGICNEHNMRYPRIGYIQDGAPNAFTYGHTKNNARIVLTKGIFDLLSEDEVKAVVAHEMGHAVHYDMLFMTVAQLVPLILYAIYDTLTSNIDDDDNSKVAAVGYIAYVLYIICQYIILWLSRTREYYADSFSAEKLKNPNVLASALVKIGYGLSATSTRVAKHSVAAKNALGIFDSRTSKSLIVTSYNNGEVSKENIKNAMKWEMWNIWAKWYELNSTHPLISRRLLALSNLSKQYGLEPYIEFDLKREESFVDDFIVELIIKYLPLLAVFVSLGLFIFFEINNLSMTLAFGIWGLLVVLAALVPFKKARPNKNYKETTVSELLGEVKVSGVRAIPCVIEGEIIGRGNPGCILNEDFVIRDNTGIVFLDYNQPLFIVNKLFAIFKSQEYFGKKVTIKGWYRRSPVPYIEVYTMTVDGKVRKCFTYGFISFLYLLFMVISIFLIFIGLYE